MPKVGDSDAYDAIVVGAGFYGCMVALYLAESRGMKNVLILERETGVMQRASANNQARVHNGYHYPRSFKTAVRSRVSYKRFVQDWAGSIFDEFHSLYAIPKTRSKISPEQFESFSRTIGASCEDMTNDYSNLFDLNRVQTVFHVSEVAFNSTELRKNVELRLREAGVKVIFDSEVRGVEPTGSNQFAIEFLENKRANKKLNSQFVFNCAYAGINSFKHPAVDGTDEPFKYELAEMAIVEMPKALQGIGVTVMDGPFFSMLPFPSRVGMHSLSHVRYTPHSAWCNPTFSLVDSLRTSALDMQSNASRMIRDAARYVPMLASVRAEKSFFEIKTVLKKSEQSDSRPIYFEKSELNPGYFAILGGKIDNIYDVLERLDGEALKLDYENI